MWGKNQSHFCNQCNHTFNLKCFYQIPLTWWKTYLLSYVPARDHTFPVGRATKLLYAIPFVATLATCGNVWLAGKDKNYLSIFTQSYTIQKNNSPLTNFESICCIVVYFNRVKYWYLIGFICCPKTSNYNNCLISTNVENSTCRIRPRNNKY